MDTHITIWEDGTLHSYTIVLTRESLEAKTPEEKLSKYEESTRSGKQIRKTLKRNSDVHGRLEDEIPVNLVSQISSTITTEKLRQTARTPLSATGSKSKSENVQRSNQYFTISSMTPSSIVTSGDSKNLISHDTTSNSTSTSSVKKFPRYTYSSLKCYPKYITMVYVKFLLLYCDVYQKRAQLAFTDEFPSDCRLEEVVINFHQLCFRHLRDQNFNPRLSFCIGDLSYWNSKPLFANDMNKTSAQLANDQSVAQLSIIVDVTDKNMKL